MGNEGHVVAVIEKDTASKFTELVNQVCKPSDFYKSDTVPRINGNVTDKLHLTFVFGLLDDHINRDSMKTRLDSLDVKTIKLGRLFVKTGFQGMYKVLMVEVIDEDGSLASIAKSFNVFDQDPFRRYEFKPRITLAYVQPDYQLPEGNFDYPKDLPIEEIIYKN